MLVIQCRVWLGRWAWKPWNIYLSPWKALLNSTWGVVLNSDFDQLNPNSLKENDWIVTVFILHGFSLGMWGRSHGNIEYHTGVRVCPLGVLTDGGVPEIPVCGVPICLCHHHCGNPPHHGHSDYWLSAPYNRVSFSLKSVCHRHLLFYSHFPKDAGGLLAWHQDHPLPGLYDPDLLPLSGRWDCLLPPSVSLWPLHSHLPAPPLCHHHEHSKVCGSRGGCLGTGLCPLHCPAGSDARITFLWPQHPR